MSECDFIRFPFVVLSWSILLEITIITVITIILDKRLAVRIFK